jgi:iron complex transport system substrate-binding protein
MLKKTVNQALARPLGILLALSLLFATLAGCQAAPAVAPSPAGDASYPLEVIDAMGQTVVIPAAPKSIIATTVWAGEIMLDLVDSSRIAGLSSWGDDPVLSPTADRAAAIPGRVDLSKPETLVALVPDLVIIDTFSDPEGALSKTLSQANIPVLQMASPVDFNMIRESIETLALATGETERGESLIEAMNAMLDEVAGAVATIPADDRLTVMYYEDYYDATGNSANMLCAYGEGSPFAAVAEAAGLVNVCNAATYSAVAKEKVVGEWRPELLVIPSMQFDENFKAIEDQGETVRAAILLDPVLKDLPAVQNGLILAIPEKYRGSTSHYMAEAVKLLAQAAYPDLVR